MARVHSTYRRHVPRGSRHRRPRATGRYPHLITWLTIPLAVPEPADEPATTARPTEESRAG